MEDPACRYSALLLLMSCLAEVLKLQQWHSRTVQVLAYGKPSGLYAWFNFFFIFSVILYVMCNGVPFSCLSMVLDEWNVYGLLSWSLKGDPYCLIRRNKVSRTWPIFLGSPFANWQQLEVDFWKLLIHAVSKNMSKNTSMIIFSFTSGMQHYKWNEMKWFFLHILLFRPALRNVMGSFQSVITVNRE